MKTEKKNKQEADIHQIAEAGAERHRGKREGEAGHSEGSYLVSVSSSEPQDNHIGVDQFNELFFY